MAKKKNAAEQKDEPSKLPLETVKVIAAVAGSLTGVVAFFSFFGFIIALSYSVSKGIYGIPQFVEQFFQEVGLIFLFDFSIALGKLPGLFSFLGITSIVVFIAIADRLFPFTMVSESEDRAKQKVPAHTRKKNKIRRSQIKEYFMKFFRFQLKKYLMQFFRLQPVFNIAIAIITIIVISKLYGFENIDTCKQVFYIFIIPSYFSLIMYLSFHHKDFTMHRSRRRFLFVILFGLFLLESILIPISYGANVFDLPLCRVIRITFKASANPVKAFQETTDPTQIGVYYLLGHTSGREVFFVSYYSQSRVEMVTIDAASIESIQLYANIEGVTEKETLNSVINSLAGTKVPESNDNLKQIEINNLLKPEGE
jgi:hypothetical protein